MVLYLKILITPNMVFLLKSCGKKQFEMLELNEIMLQGESNVFAEMLNRLRDGKHTEDDILEIK